jgi:hypothetical protein
VGNKKLFIVYAGSGLELGNIPGMCGGRRGPIAFTLKQRHIPGHHFQRKTRLEIAVTVGVSDGLCQGIYMGKVRQAHRGHESDIDREWSHKVPTPPMPSIAATNATSWRL